MVYITLEIPRIVNPPTTTTERLVAIYQVGEVLGPECSHFFSTNPCWHVSILHILQWRRPVFGTQTFGEFYYAIWYRNPHRFLVSLQWPFAIFCPWGKEWVWSDTVGLLRDRTGDIHVALAHTFHRGNRWGELIAGWMLAIQLGRLSNLGFLDKNGTLDWLVGWDGSWGYSNRRRTRYPTRLKNIEASRNCFACFVSIRWSKTNEAFQIKIVQYFFAILLTGRVG